ncbi:hypothetical protein [Nonomuraea endophytica]|uniref:hypothetical protein n=1 Tax=Nonomuraea endophytica TaxID=714136 RepID=UPI0037CC097F
MVAVLISYGTDLHVIARVILVGCAALALLTAPAAAAASSSGWSSLTSEGSVRVSADRNHITVCDLEEDGYKVEAEYATSMLGIYTVADSNQYRAGCGSDRTFISRIDVFKMWAPIRGLLTTLPTSK